MQTNSRNLYQSNFLSLENDLRRYRIASLAQGTIKTYSSGEKRFINFYHQFHLHTHLPLLPTTKNILIYFAVFLARTVNSDTIKVYLAAVRHMHLVNGYDLPIAKFQHLHHILPGIKRIKEASTRTRLPITLDHLKLFHRILHSRASPTHDEIMIWAAITTAFFVFLRIGEMTCSGLFNSSTHLSRSDVSFHDKTNDHEAFLNLRIKASKTDPFPSSTTITIGSTSGIICPVRALKTYLSRTSTDHAGPLFCSQTVLLYLVVNFLRNYVYPWYKVQVLTPPTTQATAFELGQLLQLRPKVYLIGLFKR